MASIDFTIQDIKDFMADVCKLKWCGEIYDEEFEQYRMAKMEDFNMLKTSGLIVTPIRTEAEKVFYDSTRSQELPVIIYENTFKVLMGRDYSNEWQNFKAERKEINMAAGL